MSADAVQSWHDANQRYLAAALALLRLRLTRQGSRQQPLLLPELVQQPEPSKGWRGWFGGAAPSAKVVSAEIGKPGIDSVSDEDVAKAAEALKAAEAAAQPAPALTLLADRLGLTRFESEVLLLCAAMELDTRIAGLCARAQDDAGRPYPTFALALTLFDEPAWDVLSPQRPLRFWRLLDINQPGAQPLTTSALRADERVVNYIKGLNYLDDRLAPFLNPPQDAGADEALPESQQLVAAEIARSLGRDRATQRPPIVQLLGTDTQSKYMVARCAAAGLGLHLYRLSPELLPSHLGELETLSRLWHRESLLLPIALYIDAHDGGATPNAESRVVPVKRFFARTSGVVFLDTRELAPDLGAATVAFDVAKPTPAEQQAAWAAALQTESADIPSLLTGQFDLSVTAIRDAASTARAAIGDGATPSLDVAWRTCVFHTRPRLDALAQRLNTKATWEELVLPREELELLAAISHQVRHRRGVYDQWGFRRRMNRGFGISALFAGESGTGKTMAAEVVANDLKLDLYRIDLSAVVSKYIGETEKNLRSLFDAAEDGGAILFFDEADALFGKRSEVKDSHDRYANIEINYLLQRMEGYRGLAILATNMKSALDAAFVRRLRFIVTFPYPGVNERKAMWEKAFPPETPTVALDLPRLARLNLTGGSIHNIALNAAFLAARAGSDVTMPLVLNAARVEFRKLERPINENEFRYLETAAGGTP